MTVVDGARPAGLGLDAKSLTDLVAKAMMDDMSSVRTYPAVPAWDNASSGQRRPWRARARQFLNIAVPESREQATR